MKEEVKRTGKAQTVLGLVSTKDLGVTLVHEHLLSDLSVYFQEPSAATEKALAHQAVNLENRYWVVIHQVSNLDNIRLTDEKLATEEISHYKYSGGNTVVDLTNTGKGRDPQALRRISLTTGLNIIMGSGYYVGAGHPLDMDDKTEDEIAEEIVHDITVGVDNTGICAGIIGEIGCSWPMLDNERKVLRAAVMAQQQTGAPMNIHPGRNPRSPFEVVEILGNAGADFSRTVISHMDRTLRNADERLRLVETGCYIEWDLFGWEGYYPIEMGNIDLPNDAQRINEITELITLGHLRQILISQDICHKVRLRRYGGFGYSHILDNVVPLMQRKGMTEKQIQEILVNNPKRLLQFK